MTEPQQKAERRATLDDVLARAPRVDIAFKAVPGKHVRLLCTAGFECSATKRPEFASLSEAGERGKR
jgi:hypothetical protein